MKKKSPVKKRRQLSRPYIWWLVGVGFLLIISVAAVSSSIYYRAHYIAARHTLHTYPLKIWHPHDIVQDDRFSFSFNGTRTDTAAIPHFWELAAGEQFFIVNVSFKNNTDSVYYLSPVTSMTLRDTSGTVYKVSSAPSIQNSLGGPVSPWHTVRGEVGFTVPSTVKEMTFTFDPGLPNAHHIPVVATQE